MNCRLLDELVTNHPLASQAGEAANLAAGSLLKAGWYIHGFDTAPPTDRNRLKIWSISRCLRRLLYYGLLIKCKPEKQSFASALLFTLFPNLPHPTWLRLRNDQSTENAPIWKTLWFHTCIALPSTFSLANRDICVPSPLPESGGEQCALPSPPSRVSCGCISVSGNEPQRTARLSGTAAGAEIVRAQQEKTSTFPNSTATTCFLGRKWQIHHSRHCV